ncbi:MAG: hypothetical protein R2697_05250 [Ilumatobacteraceae bacterium]
MYTCGITPYGATHLGHASTFIAYDVLQRHLIDKGHQVRAVRNVTDVDDPLFAKARSSACTISISPRRRPASSATWSPSTAARRDFTACIVGDPRRRGFIGMVLDAGYAYEAGGSGALRRVEVRSFSSLSHSPKPR